MEYRPNSGPENLSSVRSRDIGTPNRTLFGADDYHATSRLFQTVTDDHVLYKSILRWREPKFPNYNTHAARLRSYMAWPHLLAPAPERLNAAGFLYTGNHTFKILFLKTTKQIHTLTYFRQGMQCIFFSGSSDTVRWFVCGGGHNSCHFVQRSLWYLTPHLTDTASIM
jgi:hypothetical protein